MYVIVGDNYVYSWGPGDIFKKKQTDIVLKL